MAGDPRFFARCDPVTIAAIAAATGASASFDDGRLIEGVAPLSEARASELSFLDNRRYRAALRQTAAGAVLVAPAFADEVPQGTIALVSGDPYRAWAVAAGLLHPEEVGRSVRHATAVIDAAARIDASAEIGAGAVIEAGAEIGPGCRIGAHAVVGHGVVIGAACRIGAQVTLSHAVLGARVVIYPGARIGQAGFGFVPSWPFLSVPQLGRVILEDDVEIGANCTIDRGSAQDTVIGAGSRLDNLVHIGHNVRLGRGCVVVAQVGISGSTVVEDFVMIGGQAGLTGHLRIGKGARIGAQSGLMSDVPAGAEVMGSPAEPIKQYWRRLAALRRMARTYRAGRGVALADRDAPADAEE